MKLSVLCYLNCGAFYRFVVEVTTFLHHGHSLCNLWFLGQPSSSYFSDRYQQFFHFEVDFFSLRMYK